MIKFWQFHAYPRVHSRNIQSHGPSRAYSPIRSATIHFESVRLLRHLQYSISFKDHKSTYDVIIKCKSMLLKQFDIFLFFIGMIQQRFRTKTMISKIKRFFFSKILSHIEKQIYTIFSIRPDRSGQVNSPHENSCVRFLKQRVSLVSVMYIIKTKISTIKNYKIFELLP